MKEIAELSRARAFDEMRTTFVRQMRKVPGAMAIIATQAGSDRRGLVATAWASLSADPPSLMVAVNRNASAHDSIIANGRFSVNQLHSDHAELVAIFSNQRGLQGGDRFLAADWRPGSSDVPVLASAVTVFECRVAEHHQFGSHTIFVGEVERLWEADHESHPGVYCHGRIHAVVATAS